MSWPAPKAGQVIRYSYLWQAEAAKGREEGVKDRPCAVVLLVEDTDGRPMAYVLPVTHSPPADPATAIEIPQETKKRLGLDGFRSCIMLNETNAFSWPGPDLRPGINGDLSTVVYGMLPPNFFNHVRRRFVEFDAGKRLQIVRRTE